MYASKYSMPALTTLDMNWKNIYKLQYRKYSKYLGVPVYIGFHSKQNNLSESVGLHIQIVMEYTEKLLL